MRFERRPPDNSERSVLPLINVVFLLLIFCMLAGSLGRSEPFAVTAPRSTSDGAQQQTLRLLLGSEGQLALQGEVMSEAELLQQVGQRIANHPGVGVELKADAALAGNRVVLLMEKLGEAGVDRLLLLTQSEP
ncbi:MAG: biopolymer transporter ExbD [Gammaproteobacteria bacterium]|nr:biopolymer transporter ExbD [Gammaproteobacteria bacterium]